MEHAMYVMQVKKPSASKYPWDYYRVVQKMSGDRAFGKLAEFDLPAGEEVRTLGEVSEPHRHGRARPGHPCRWVANTSGDYHDLSRAPRKKAANLSILWTTSMPMTAAMFSDVA